MSRTGSNTAEVSPATRLTILFLTVFVDLVGFGIVLPLLPFYADRFGASGLEVGWLVAVYSLAQLVFAPLWGRLSDRYGRRPILIVGLVGSAFSYVVFGYADSLLLLFISRVMAGVGGANIPVAQAYIADITPPSQRAGNMGLIGAAFGLGFIFGPAIGGILAPVSTAAPGLAAAGLCFSNAILAFFLLPESLPPEERGAPQTGTPPVRLEQVGHVFRTPVLLLVMGLFFLFTVAFSMMHPTFPLFAAERFSLGERSVGYLFAFIGLCSAVMQGGIVRILAPRLGEERLIRLAGLVFVLGFLGVAWAPDLGTLLVALAVLAVGFGGSLPAITSLMSREAPTHLQGSILGLGQSVGATARVLGPILAGLIFDGWGIQWPYLVAAIIGGMALVPAVALGEGRVEGDVEVAPTV